ncbi:Gfo/Idh/MocA family oxidoreductase [Amycolatopsis sp. SID8362]|uniref:Gfo/Idh/MocA family protein n=1 Tax=Amycolatopsis sp. SID8362 TaxID=2690346 RepID=UPI00136BCC01|nr:Gfo/Idh/MocA family oxidoreductase [Amycolatopsis sp. SID8362]NBH10995.1 Gfo/Idh/MocA family oxidoreductase [Amycolatopsis sp. SID8362]NED47686.1 Gfo/Idh/MocA family oxidoreductase [Amycolatopsis sp. SID8362]
MDVVIAGYGHAGELHARLLAARSGVRIVGVTDRTATRRAAAATRFPYAVTAAGLDELDVRADAVVVCTPPAHHETDTRTALARHHAHVLCEKPAVLDAGAGRRLGRTAAEAGLVLQPVHNYLISPAITELHRTACRSLGRIDRVTIAVTRTGPASGHPAWQPDWRTDPAAGGGILHDHGPHACYLAFHLAGQPATSIRCMTTIGEHGADHSARLDLRLANGSSAAIRLSWQGSSRENLYRLSGEHGTAQLRNGQLELTTPTGTYRKATEDHSIGGHTNDDWIVGVHQTFLEQATGTRRRNEQWDTAVHVAEVLATARTSAATGQDWLPVGHTRQ